MTKRIRLNMLENAKDSLGHAVEHLTSPEGIRICDYKRVIRDLAHAVELLLKEKLARIHPSFIWENIDKYPSSTALKISTDKAIDRLLRLGNIQLPVNQISTIKACKGLRNNIEHYEFEYDEKEAKAIIGRILSFIFDFSDRYLGLHLHEEFKKDDTWNALIDIYEFWEAYGQVLGKQLSEQGRQIVDCGLCGAQTFDIEKSCCELCGNRDDQVECNKCHEIVLESYADEIEYIEGDSDMESPAYSTVTICKDCLEKEAAEEAAVHQGYHE